MSRTLVAALLLGLMFLSPLRADNFAQWRGDGLGQAGKEDVPQTWSAKENVKWKVALPAGGNSTPIVWGDQVFLTTPGDEDGRIRSLYAFNRNTGEQNWVQSVEYPKKEVSHKTNPQCSSSPTTDGERVVAWFGSAGLHCYDMQGNPQWNVDLGKFEHIWGVASSPVIYGDLVILNCGPGVTAFVIALNKKTGEEVWRRDIPNMESEKASEFRGSWSTPVIAPSSNGDVLILSLPLAVYALDPKTGEEQWRCEGLTKLVYTSALVSEKYVVAMSGYGGAAVAVKRGGEGDVTESHRLWRHEKKNPQRVGSGVIVGDYLYILNEPGIAWCIEIATGEIAWQKRISGSTWASMTHVDGLLYVINQAGTTFVLKPNPKECEVVAENKIGETTRGSLAFSNGQVFIHTYENLYCIEKK